MKLLVYSVYDNKMREFYAPFYAHKDSDAVRDFYKILHAPDFVNTFDRAYELALYCVGEFDTCTGKFKTNIMRHVVEGSCSTYFEDINKQIFQKRLTAGLCRRAPL